MMDANRHQTVRPRVLVIDDEADIREILEHTLREEGYDVRGAETGEAGYRQFETFSPQLVLLDLMLPDTSGIEICRRMRANTTVERPTIVILSARTDEIDRVVAFEVGVDDYVVKPFSVRELLLRIQAILRRSAGGVETEATTVFGRLKIDRNAHRVWVDETELELTALEFKLLVTLHERKNRVQTRNALLNDVWGIEADITTRTVDTHVKRLREKLGEAGAYVETVRGVGYRFADAPPEG